MTAVKLPLIVLSLPVLAGAIGMADGQFSREDWGNLGVAVTGSVVIAAKEIETRWLRAKLNNPRYLLRRGLALLDKRRDLSVVLIGAAAASLLIAVLPSRIVSAAWDQQFVAPVHAYSTPLHRRPHQEVTSESSTAKPAEAGATPLQRGRSELVGRPSVGGPDQGTGISPAEAGQQCVSPADVLSDSRFLVPRLDVHPDLSAQSDDQSDSVERQGLAIHLNVQPPRVPSGGRAAPSSTQKSPPSRMRAGQEGRDG